MIEKLLLKNYRGFRSHTVPFESLTIIVGRNNAGKSTIVEALRLVSIIVNRAQHLTYTPPPRWLDIPVGARGVKPSLKGLDFDFRSVCHRYGQSPAILTAVFRDKTQVDIYVSKEEEEVFAVITGKNRKLVQSRAHARNLFPTQVNILPPIGPLARSEKPLVPEYVQSSIGTNLAPIHFRNQLSLYYDEHFTSFCSMAEESWEHLQIKELERKSRDPDLSLLVRDGPFVAEVAWVGHGLQAWLQIIWFLARIDNNGTVILDEPDVYLHADLQRKLIKMLKNRYKQVIVATHSVEIMADVDPNNILIVDKNANKSRFANSLPGVQEVIDRIGWVHNLQLSRLWAARRCLFVEGKDINLLSIFQSILFPTVEDPIETIPYIPLGGWGNWRHAVGGTIGLKNAGDQAIKTYCILDSDYKTLEEKAALKKKARQHGLQIHIWSRKEIENYLIVPLLFYRFILKRAGAVDIDLEMVVKAIDDACERQKESILDAISTELLASDRNFSLKNANKQSRCVVGDRWGTLDGKISLVSGKKLFSDLSAWCQKNYKVSLSVLSIAREMKESEIDKEVKTVICCISKSKDFSEV